MQYKITQEKLILFWKLARFDKPIGTLLLLYPTIWGLWFASNGKPHLDILFIFIIGVIFTRAGGCVINDIADRHFDKHVERTKDRPLTSGKLSVKEALIFAVILFLIAFLFALHLNFFTIELSFLALFLACSYPFTKRFFPLPQSYLGLAFGMSIPMAFTAESNTLPTVAILLLLANIFWSLAYDTAYAMTDKPDDLKIGIKTSAITFGDFDAQAVLICHIFMMILMFSVGFEMNRHIIYFISLLISCYLIQHQYLRLKTRDRSECFKIFLENNKIGWIISLGLILDYLIFN